MKQYLLDANVLGAYLQERSGALSLARTWIHNDEAATSIVVYGELTEYLKSFADFPRHAELSLPLLSVNRLNVMITNVLFILAADICMARMFP